MFSDLELDAANNQLEAFRTVQNSHHTTLTEILDKYSTLVQNYRRLRSDLEEERDARERYKQLAKGQERNPFVLVLIDGDHYVFDEDLVSNGPEGGQRAAKLLNDTVKSSLRARGLDHCRIMVRIYANLSGLSRALHRVKLIGSDMRSLAPFIASFNRSNDLFDFVDAGDLKENADFKIRALFRQFVDNAQCRHIYFAGCHDVGYISELTPYIGNRDRITLVRGSLFHPEFSKLNLRVEDFSNTFRALPLDGVIPTIPAPKISSVPSGPANAMPVMSTSPQVCSFFQKGHCRNGAKCKFAHIKVIANGDDPSYNTSSLSDTRDVHKNSIYSQPSLPYRPNSLTRNENEFVAGRAGSTQSQPDFAAMLPPAKSIPVGHVAVNKALQRLDPYLIPTTPEQRAAFSARTAIRKLCNHFHINKTCPKGNACPYDHGRASPEMLNCLKDVVFSTPCPRKASCRSDICLHGHICQKIECKYRGGKTYCKFPTYIHDQDLNFANVELAVGSRANDDIHEINDAIIKDSDTTQMGKRKSWVTVSDDEAEDGALLSPAEGAPV